MYIMTCLFYSVYLLKIWGMIGLGIIGSKYANNIIQSLKKTNRIIVL